LIEERSRQQLKFHVTSLYPLLYRLEERGWLHGRWVEKAGERREQEIVEELSQHLDQRCDELVAEGVSEGDAQRVALDELRNPITLAHQMASLQQSCVATSLPVASPSSWPWCSRIRDRHSLLHRDREPFERCLHLSVIHP